MRILTILPLVVIVGCFDDSKQQITQLQNAVKVLSDQNFELKRASPGEQPETIREIKRLQEEIKEYQAKLRALQEVNSMLVAKAERQGISPAASVINDEFISILKSLSALSSRITALESRMCKDCNKEHPGYFGNTCKQ